MGNEDIIFPELSYKIIGAAFKVFNELGYGLPEKHYQSALAKELKELDIVFEKEAYIPLKYIEKNIGKQYADFFVEKKIILELKVVSRLGYVHVGQVLSYLRATGIKLGILLYFTRDGVKYRRVLNSRAR